MEKQAKTTLVVIKNSEGKQVGYVNLNDLMALGTGFKRTEKGKNDQGKGW